MGLFFNPQKRSRMCACRACQTCSALQKGLDFSGSPHECFDSVYLHTATQDQQKHRLFTFTNMPLFIRLKVCLFHTTPSFSHSLSHRHVWSRFAQVFTRSKIQLNLPSSFVWLVDRFCVVAALRRSCCRSSMVSAEDVVAMDAILAHMEALVQTQQVTIQRCSWRKDPKFSGLRHTK